MSSGKPPFLIHHPVILTTPFLCEKLPKVQHIIDNLELASGRPVVAVSGALGMIVDMHLECIHVYILNMTN